MEEFLQVVHENHYYDGLFMSLDDKFEGLLTTQKYDPYNIDFDCLRGVIDYF